jgi:hypothetical protein
MRQLDQDGVEPLSGSYPVHITIADVGGGILESKAVYPEGYPVFTRADPDAADTDGESGQHGSVGPDAGHDPVDQKSAEPSARKSPPKKKPAALQSRPNANRKRSAAIKVATLPRKRPIPKPVKPITPGKPVTSKAPGVNPAFVSAAPPKAASLSIKANVMGVGADMPRGRFTFAIFDGAGIKVSETRNGTVDASPDGTDTEATRARRLAEAGKTYEHYAVGSAPRGMTKPIFDPAHMPIVSTKPAP